MTNREPFEFKETDDAVTLSIITKCASKWLLMDRETGQVYIGNENGYWDKLKPVQRVDK